MGKEPVAKSKPKQPKKTAAATKPKASKDDMDLESEKKKAAKKPPVKPPAAKGGKENAAPKWKKGDAVRKPKVLQEKVKQLTKSQSASGVLNNDPPQPSTSKQRTTKAKAGK